MAAKLTSLLLFKQIVHLYWMSQHALYPPQPVQYLQCHPVSQQHHQYQIQVEQDLILFKICTFSLISPGLPLPLPYFIAVVAGGGVLILLLFLFLIICIVCFTWKNRKSKSYKKYLMKDNLKNSHGNVELGLYKKSNPIFGGKRECTYINTAIVSYLDSNLYMCVIEKHLLYNHIVL